mgnify:CR=1 FL=1
MVQETKPKLEIGREYKFGANRGTYLGLLNMNSKTTHIFLIRAGERLYGFYNDRWICESEGNITHNLISPEEPEYFSEKQIKERGLSNILKQLGEER